MEALHVAHLLALGMWLGIVLTEALFEYSGSDAQSLRAAARFHYAVDKYAELPILVAVVITGVLLSVRVWPPEPLLLVKIAAASVAVAANLICAVWVMQRRRVEDVDVLLGFRRRIWGTAAVGVVFGTLALYLGLAYFHA